ncbi:MAG: hypothetical protein R6U68_10445 [Desulfobacteraceae bacterium]
MIIVSNVNYPPESARDIANRYLKAPPLPDYITKKGPYISSDLATGIQSMTYYELETHRLDEGLLAVAESLAVYFGVPGYTYEIKPFFELEEGLKVLGL